MAIVGKELLSWPETTKCTWTLVVAFRKKYLERIGKLEDNKELKAAAQEVGDVDWAAIEAKIQEETEKEKKKWF